MQVIKPEKIIETITNLKTGIMITSGNQRVYLRQTFEET
jgi:hypothetical protein